MARSMAEPFSIPGLLDGGWLSAAFGPFRDGVDICVLVAGA
ncbi:MAG: allophanate hydrolase, partial [Alphaproteobacteria bacterium HGW-Alphaproteobacteria-8]